MIFVFCCTCPPSLASGSQPSPSLRSGRCPHKTLPRTLPSRIVQPAQHPGVAPSASRCRRLHWPRSQHPATRFRCCFHHPVGRGRILWTWLSRPWLPFCLPDFWPLTWWLGPCSVGRYNPYRLCSVCTSRRVAMRRTLQSRQCVD